MTPIAAKVANRWAVRDACRRICAAPSFRARRASLSGLTPEALEAFASFWEPPEGKVAFGGIVRRLKQLADGFKKAPRLWETFKKGLGIESLADIPKAIMTLAKAGKAALGKAFKALFDTWPLKVYTLDKSKLFSVQGVIDGLMKRFPQFSHWLDAKVKPKVNQVDAWFRANAPTLSKVVIVAVYLFIWFNVTEFEWDFHTLVEDLGAAFSGSLSLADILTDLPSSAVGALLNLFNFGTFTLLPAAFAARLVWLLVNKYVRWTGRGFEFDWDKLSDDLGVSKVGLETAVR